MTLITEANTTEEALRHYVAEASSLGLPPGHWPSQIETTLGNGEPFNLVGCVGGPGGLDYVTYAQQHGALVLRIFND